MRYYSYLLLTLFLFTITLAVEGQTLKGTITGSDMKPVSYATVYISDLRQGTTANIKGEYQINLKPGTYNVYFQSLGFSPEPRTVSISEGETILNITLLTQLYEIPEVRVNSSGEDPAYAIMRKAIGMAPYYLNQVQHYTAEIYIKGSMVVRKIPKIMKKRIEVNEENIREGEVYLIEALNEIEFTAPDKYKQTVLAQQSTFPTSGEGSDISPLDVINASFYQPILADLAISPLAPNAMSYYRFKYEGSTPQGNYIVDKISVIPKRKSQQVFEGTIYIIEDYWCLHSVDLLNENLAGSISIKQVYTPVVDGIWMPVSHNFVMNISIVGIKADAAYGSSVTYKSVIENSDLPRPTDLPMIDPNAVTEDEPEAAPTKEQQKIDELLSKDNISNRDMIKLSRLMEKEAKKTDTADLQLEIKSTTDYVIADDADKRDTSFWNDMRPIPLSDEELTSIRLKQSNILLKSSNDSTSAGDTLNANDDASSRRFRKMVNNISFGKSFYSEEKGTSFRFGGLVNTDMFTFNSVDGVRYGTNFSISKRWENKKSISINPTVEWAFGRERLLWRVNTSFNYNRMKQSRIFIWAGRSSHDFNMSAGISPAMNMLTTLLYKENYLKLYESNFITIGHRNEILNGLYAEFRYNYEDRRMLTNHSDFSFFKRDLELSPNVPVNYYLPEIPAPGDRYGLYNTIHHDGQVSISYIPKQRYYLRDGVKSPAGSSYPTFKLTWEYGVNSRPDEGYRTYNLLKAEASKTRSIGAFSEYGWMLGAGGFIDNTGLTFPDFVHFNSQPLPVLLTNYRNVFMLPSYYSLATPEYYAVAHFRFTTPYLLIKLIPGISNTLMRENLTFAWLYTPHTKNYYEFGYALSEIFLVGRLGVYTGFENFTWKGAGLRFTFVFN